MRRDIQSTDKIGRIQVIKRIIAGILGVAMAAFALCGCSFFSHDYERDMKQEIAGVSAYTIVNEYLKDDGSSQKYEYKTAKKTIYKLDLIEYVQNNASSLSSAYAGNAKGLYNYAVNMLVNVEILMNEVDALIAADQVEWGIEQFNTIKQSLYTVIDNAIFSQKNAILSERDQEQIVKPDADTSTASTTFPVKPDVTDDVEDGDDEIIHDVQPWEPAKIMCPGINGDNDTRSLEREAMRRFIALIKSRVNDDFRLDMPERAWLKTKINAEIKAINKLIDTQGIEAVYPVIGNYSYPMKESQSEFGYILYYLSGESIERSQKINAMQEFLEDSVDVKYEEVADKFNTALAEQETTYKSDISAYDTAINDGNTTVLYHANNNYFYVKHILLPFSDDQKAALTDFRNSPEISHLQADERDERVNEYREWLAQSIVCYPHKDGENDTTKPMSVDEVMAHVRSVMTPLASNVKKANDAFNDLIYLYNTDPGAFGNDKGYIVKYKLDEGESETYMQEFADAARDMRNTIEVGRVYDKQVITDYGVHVMYLASVPKLGAVSLSDYTTPDRSQTYYDVFAEPIRSARREAAYTDWQNNILIYNYKKYSKLYTENFSDLWEN